MPISLDNIKKLLKDEKIEWKKHALKRLIERGISNQEVLDAIGAGEIIETYNDDKPFPSHLILGCSGNKPLHVVLASDECEEIIFIITMYVPSPAEWHSDWKRRR